MSRPMEPKGCRGQRERLNSSLLTRSAMSPRIGRVPMRSIQSARVPYRCHPEPPTQRAFFGEACENERMLIESNPGVDVIHPHTNDLEYPDRFDCNAWRRCEESHSRRMQGGYGASALHYVDSLRMQVSRDHQPLADEGAGGPARSKILPRRDCIRDTKSWIKCKL